MMIEIQDLEGVQKKMSSLGEQTLKKKKLLYHKSKVYCNINRMLTVS